MNAAIGKTPHDVEDSRREESAESERFAATWGNGSPLPGVVDFVGAHVGGELAEERWR